MGVASTVRVRFVRSARVFNERQEGENWKNSFALVLGRKRPHPIDLQEPEDPYIEEETQSHDV